MATLQWPLTEGKKAAISVISAFDLIQACSSLKPLIEGKIDAWNMQPRHPISTTPPPPPTAPTPRGHPGLSRVPLHAGWVSLLSRRRAHAIQAPANGHGRNANDLELHGAGYHSMRTSTYLFAWPLTLNSPGFQSRARANVTSYDRKISKNNLPLADCEN